MKLLLPLLMLVFAKGVGAQSQAEDNDQVPDWYRVELLIFANRDPESAASESWPLLPQLTYPEQMLRLRHGPENGPANISYTLLPVEQQVPAPVFDLAWDGAVAAADSRNWRAPSVQLEPLFQLEIPLPYMLLPTQRLELAEQQRRLARSRNFQVLYHASWLQPMRDRRSTTPIEIDSEFVAGEYPALQGSIFLYSARYLHLETNLWLNTDGSYLNNEWVMPLPPLPPGEPQQLAAPAFAVVAPAGWLDELVTPDVDVHPDVDTDVDSEVDSDVDTDVDSEVDTDVDSDAEPEVSSSAIELATAFLNPVADYNFRHAVLVQQRRRMRSGELHYIDHPMLGVLIKVSRYEFEPFTTDLQQHAPGTAENR